MRSMERRLRKLEGSNNPFDRLSDAELERRVELLARQVDGTITAKESAELEGHWFSHAMIPSHMVKAISGISEEALDAEIAKMLQELPV